VSDEHDITKDPEYKTSLAALDEAIRSHYSLIERKGNEYEPESGEERGFVFGWVLGIGTMGTDGDGDEYSDVLVEHADAMNDYTVQGVADHTYRFIVAQNNNYTGNV
jgi:hypothetical protein